MGTISETLLVRTIDLSEQILANSLGIIYLFCCSWSAPWGVQMSFNLKPVLSDKQVPSPVTSTPRPDLVDMLTHSSIWASVSLPHLVTSVTRMPGCEASVQVTVQNLMNVITALGTYIPQQSQETTNSNWMPNLGRVAVSWARASTPVLLYTRLVPGVPLTLTADFLPSGRDGLHSGGRMRPPAGKAR